MIYLAKQAQVGLDTVKAYKNKEKLNLRKISIYTQRLHTRRQLKQLNADQLADIGISEEQAIAEASLPFWR